MVIHDALGPEDGFSPERAGQFRARVGITDEAVLVGAAGRFDTWKGFDVLLEAFPEIRRHRPDLELVVAGGPVQGKEAYAAGLEALAAQTEGVHWIGSRSDMPEFMADLDVFVLASTEPEPFASVSVEAMASGVPVVATDHGGSPEMLSEGPEGSGGLFAPRDPMALAEAVVAMAPEHPSSVARRRARTPTYIGDASSFVRLFDEALG
jgi:glycosyltransferase involved in cell wall biosynthesis